MFFTVRIVFLKIEKLNEKIYVIHSLQAASFFVNLIPVFKTAIIHCNPETRTTFPILGLSAWLHKKKFILHGLFRLTLTAEFQRSRMMFSSESTITVVSNHEKLMMETQLAQAKFSNPDIFQNSGQFSVILGDFCYNEHVCTHHLKYVKHNMFLH